jgi:hypothetical protein
MSCVGFSFIESQRRLSIRHAALAVVARYSRQSNRDQRFVIFGEGGAALIVAGPAQYHLHETAYGINGLGVAVPAGLPPVAIKYPDAAM